MLEVGQKLYAISIGANNYGRSGEVFSFTVEKNGRRYTTLLEDGLSQSVKWDIVEGLSEEYIRSDYTSTKLKFFKSLEELEQFKSRRRVENKIRELLNKCTHFTSYGWANGATDKQLDDLYTSLVNIFGE